MTAEPIRILLVADTHLGFDLPFRPRVRRRRRGPDFFANLDRALQPALRGQVDLVVHGGDLFFRTRVPTALVEMAMEPLLRVARAGTPVYLVPGNHERSRIPLHLWTAHPRLHIFDRPTTFTFRSDRGTVALAGFPFARSIAGDFSHLLTRTGLQQVTAHWRLLCFHQTVEGAQVGGQNYTFRSGADVLPGRAIPSGLDAILSGHIHRAQVLRHDLQGVPLAAPVVYPGSIERTSFAERSEEKGYMLLTLHPRPAPGCQPVQVDFIPLPARPMVSLELRPPDPAPESLSALVAGHLRVLDPDSVVRLQFRGPNAEAALRTLTAARLRQLAPPTMNVSLASGHRAPFRV